MKLNRNLLTAFALTLCTAIANAQNAACPQAEAEAADAAADTLSSWQAIATYYRRNRSCDDGGIAEASSERVARLLVDHWTTLPALATEIKHTPGLQSFISAHINATLDTKDIETIARASRRSCPGGASSLCRAIRDASDSARR